MYVHMYICLYICIILIVFCLDYFHFTEPSCYVATNCNEGLINRSIAFSDCCTNFGASFDFNGRCQPCPSTSKWFYKSETYVRIYNIMQILHSIWLHHLCTCYSCNICVGNLTDMYIYMSAGVTEQAWGLRATLSLP